MSGWAFERGRAVAAGIGAAIGAAVVWWLPSSFDSERWSLCDPGWRRAALALLAGHAAVTARLGAQSRLGARWAAIIPVLLTCPALLGKALLTRLPLPRGDILALVAPFLAAAIGGGLVGRMVAAQPAKATVVALATALLGVAIWPGVRYGELSAQEELVVSGRVEEVLRDLAARISRDSSEAGLPPADGGAWLRERLLAEGWYEAEGLWWWAPAEGVGPGPVRLRYQPPQPDDPPWAVVLTSVPVTFVRRDAKPFEAQITLDGGVQWLWPAGPPPPVAERSGAFEQP